MNNSAPLRSIPATRLAAFAVALLTLAATGCNQTLHGNLTTVRAALRTHVAAEPVGSLAPTAPPTNLDDYRHPTRLKVNAAYHRQPH